jgi:hypothetical protein
MTPITRSRFRPRYPSSSFAPGLLFLAGEQGAWYDPSDLSTLFQDAAGTVPVTAVGQSVRLMRDKSGRGNNATAPSDAARPVLQQDSSGLLHLLFNGSNSSMVTGAIDFSSTNKVSAFAGATKLIDGSTFQCIVELSADSNSNLGTFVVGAATVLGDASRRTWAAGVTGTSVLLGSAAIFAAPDTRVMAANFDLAGATAADQCALRLNGIAQTLTYNIANAGSRNFISSQIYIGRRGGSANPFNGRLYGLIVRGTATSAAQVTSTERWLAGKTGVTI